MSSDLIFWICAAALLLLLEVCLYIGLRSSSKTEVENTGLNRLVYQDQFQTLNQELAEHRISKAVYDAELSELEARAVEETVTPNVAYRNPSWVKPVSIFLCLLVPLTAVFLYFSWANPSLVTYKGTPEALAAAQPADRIGQLKTFLKESPRAVRAWLALADEFGREGQYKEAVNAMNEAFHVSPNGVAKTADYRVQRAVFALETSDPMLRSQAVSDLEQAVKLEPSNIRALELGGIVAYQRSIQQSSRILAGAAASDASGFSGVFAALGCHLGCQEPCSNELQVLDLRSQRHFARLAVEVSREFNFAVSKLQRSRFDFLAAQLALFRTDVQSVTNAVAAAHDFCFAFMLSFLKGRFGDLSSVKFVKLKRLLVHDIAVIVQFFNREDGGCVISCLRKNFSLLRTILFQTRDQLSAKTVKHRSAHKTGMISLNLDIVGNKVGGAEFGQGAQNLFFDCLRILGFRERF